MVPSRECIILTRLRNLYGRFNIAHASKVTKVVRLVDHLGFIYINGAVFLENPGVNSLSNLGVPGGSWRKFPAYIRNIYCIKTHVKKYIISQNGCKFCV